MGKEARVDRVRRCRMGTQPLSVNGHCQRQQVNPGLDARHVPGERGRWVAKDPQHQRKEPSTKEAKDVEEEIRKVFRSGHPAVVRAAERRR